MGDNLDSNPNETSVNEVATSKLNVNNQDVNTTSYNSLTVSERVKMLNKAPSFTSETSVKSSKSTKSELNKDKTKKRNKVKNMIKKIEKRIIHNGKKERNDDVSYEFNETEKDIEQPQEDPQPINEDKATEINNNNNQEVVEEVVVIEEIIEVVDDNDKKEEIVEVTTLEEEKENTNNHEEEIIIEKEENHIADEIKEDKKEQEQTQEINNVEKETEENQNVIIDNIKEEEEKIDVENQVEETNINTIPDNINNKGEENNKIVETKIIEVKEIDNSESEPVDNIEPEEEKEPIIEEDKENVIENEQVNNKEVDESTIETEVKESIIENEENEKESETGVKENEAKNEIKEKENNETETENEIKENKENETETETEIKENIIQNEETEIETEIEIKENNIQNEENEAETETEIKENIIQNEEKEIETETKIKENDTKDEIETEVKENVIESEEKVDNEKIEVALSDNAIEPFSEKQNIDSFKKDSIISQLSEVINTDSESLASEHDTSLISSTPFEEPISIEEENQQMIEQSFIAVDEDKRTSNIEIQSVEPINRQSVSVVDKSDNDNINDQPLQADVIDLSNVSTVPESEIRRNSSDDSFIAEELNEVSNALKSINDINKTEMKYQVLNPNLEEILNKSIQRNNNKMDLLQPNNKHDSLDVKSLTSDKRNSYRNSFQSSQSIHSHRSHQSGSGSVLNLQIAPPQPPPATPLPPTPHGPLPPSSVLDDEKVSEHSDSSSERRKQKGHLQHLSLGRLTEFNNNEDQEIQDQLNANRVSNDLSSTDNSVPLSSNVQTVTIQNVNETENIRAKKRSRNSQPLQAVVYKIESESDEDSMKGSLEAQVYDNEDEIEMVKDVKEEGMDEEKKENINETENGNTTVIETSLDNDKSILVNNKAEASKKLKDTFSNIENLLDDLDSHIQQLKTPKMKAVETQDGYEGDDEIKYNMKQKDATKLDSTHLMPDQYTLNPQQRLPGAYGRSNMRNPAVTNSMFVEGSIPELNAPGFGNHNGRSNSVGSAQKPKTYLFNDSKRPVSSYNRKSYYTESLGETNDILPLPAVVEGPMSPESVHDIIIQNTLQNMNSPHSNVSMINELYGMDDDEFDIDKSLNNNLKMLKSSTQPGSIRDSVSVNRKMNGESPAISTKALKLVGVENQSIPNMSAKALKMLGMNAPKDKDDFANFQFDERELAMLNAAPAVDPHLTSGRRSSSSSKPLTDDFMPMGVGMNPNMSMDALEEEQIKHSLLFGDNDDDDLLRDPNMLTIGSAHSNNSFNSSGNNSFTVSQKAMKVFGISENDLKNNPSMVSPSGKPKSNAMTSRKTNMGYMSPMSPRSQPLGLPMDNLNLSRYSINDGENQINGIISSKALKIIGLEDTSSNPPTTANTSTSKKSENLESKKASKSNKKEKLKEWEEVKDSARNLMPTLASLKPILTDNLYFNTHGLIKGWKKRFVVLTQDNWIYYFINNDPKSHALASIPINSNTTVEEFFDPINIVPYFIEIVSNWPVGTDNKRFITIGVDSKQKCQSWMTSIKSLIARDKFSNAKLPPKPTMNGFDDDLDFSNINIKPNSVSNPLLHSNFRNGRPVTMNGGNGDLGSLYDDITGYVGSSPSNLERSNTYGDAPLTSPLISPLSAQSPNDYRANVIKKSPVKNVRLTKHPVRKESFKPHYASMMGSPNMAALNSNRMTYLNSPSSQSTIPMVSSSPLLKGQMPSYASNYANASPSYNTPNNNNQLNGFHLTSPSLTPMSLPAVSPSVHPLTTPSKTTIGGPNYRRSPLLNAESLSQSSAGMAHSPLLSPKSKPANSMMMGSPYLQGYHGHSQESTSPFGNKYGNGRFMGMEEDRLEFDSLDTLDQAKLLQQQRMLQQEQLIKQQQQQIYLLQRQLLKNQKEMEQEFNDLPKDKNFY